MIVRLFAGGLKVRAVEDVFKIELGRPSFYPTLEGLTDALILAEQP